MLANQAGAILNLRGSTNFGQSEPRVEARGTDHVYVKSGGA